MALQNIEELLKIPPDLKFPEELKDYFEELIEKVRKAYRVAIEARKKGLDPRTYPEIKLASDMASRVEALVGPPKVAARIRELIREGKEVEDIAFIVAKEIAQGKYGIDNPEKRAEQAIKTAMAILAGITAAPIEGITHVKIRNDGHLAVYYAGPIRSAGGTEAALSVVIADVVRKELGLPKYNITKPELERFIEEVFLYDRYMNLQYAPDREKLEIALKNLPIEITGEGTIDAEVSGRYRNLPNIETNKVRGGAVLVLNDGVIAKAKKILKIIKRNNIEGWEWLEKLVKEEEGGNEQKKIVEPDKKYLSDVIAGRPVLSSPSKIGGFRLRYGRSRNTGLAALGIHPSLMILTDNFLSVGIQIKTERPGKGAVVMPVDSILPPLVKLKDGTVKFVQSVEEASKIKDEVEEILFLGDLLVSIGEFLENNHIILPSPYVEEWWIEELKRKIKEVDPNNIQKIDKIVDRAKNDAKFSIEISRKFGIPIHPKFTYFWRNIRGKDLNILKDIILKCSDPIIEFDAKIKKIFEKLFLPHKVMDGKIILNREDFIALKMILETVEINNSFAEMDALEILNKSGWKVRDKYPIFIGARIGRPEKAKPRMMKPPVNVLFPIGEIGTRSRSIVRASKKKLKTVIEAVNKFCPTCNIYTYLNKCPKCGRRTIQAYLCERCGFTTLQKMDRCPRCSGRIVPYRRYEINLASIITEATKRLKVGMPKDVKGVKGLTSMNKTPEILEKGILRGKYGLYVFKDGTIRFDATNCPLTHFRPKEIGVSVEKLKQLGYLYDINGRPLESDDQVLELKVQDIIINEAAADYFLKVGAFIDELLEKVYGLEKFYNFKSKEDLIGHLVIGIAPHTSAGIIGRIIGFTKAQCTFAHPYWHAAKRRNCDGDEDAIILLLDALINFSIDYLPKTRGGFMDAPLVVTTILNPLEVDSEVYNMDVQWKIPLEFFEKSLEFPEPSEIEELVINIEKRLGKESQYKDFGYTHETSDISSGNTVTSYKSLETMKDKIQKQFEVMKRIKAVEIEEVADKILEVHLMPDILGNLRSFGTQQFRCIDCNRKFRRPILRDKCPHCGGRIVQTVFRKTVLKYVPFVEEIINRYGASMYMKSRFKVSKLTDIKVFEENKSILDEFTNLEPLDKKPKKGIKGVGRGKKVSLDDLI